MVVRCKVVRLQGFNCYLDDPKPKYLIICSLEKLGTPVTVTTNSRDASASKNTIHFTEKSKKSPRNENPTVMCWDHC